MAVCDGDWINFHEVEDLHATMRGLIMALCNGRRSSIDVAFDTCVGLFFFWN